LFLDYIIIIILVERRVKSKLKKKSLQKQITDNNQQNQSDVNSINTNSVNTEQTNTSDHNSTVQTINSSSGEKISKSLKSSSDHK